MVDVLILVMKLMIKILKKETTYECGVEKDIKDLESYIVFCEHTKMILGEAFSEKKIN